MRSKIFWSLLCSALFILISSMTVFFILIYSTLADNERMRLANFTKTLASVVQDEPADFSSQINFITKIASTDYRITLIAPDGQVLYDNEQSALSLNNHADRTEVKAALAYGFGSSYRYSDSMQHKIYYYAQRLSNGEVLRCAATTETVLALLRRMALHVMVILLAMIMFSSCIAKHLSQRIIEPLNAIDLKHPLLAPVYEEIMPFIKKITAQQRQIDDQIEEIKQRNNDFYIITQSMSEGLILLNRNGNILSINKTARKIFGVNKDCVGKNFIIITKDEDVRAAFGKDLVFSNKKIEMNKNGRVYQIHINQIHTDNSLRGYALIIIDITDRKLAETQRQEFTANVSHELKTPLQAMIGYAELIENGLVKDQDIKTFAGRICSQGSKMITLIEDIIFLSRLDEGTPGICEPLDMYKICHEIFESLAHKAQQHQVSMQLEGPNIQFDGIYRYIYEMLYNLCDNAIKYNNQGGKVIVILQESSKDITIMVKDTGIGIPPEHQQRIFERFYRVDKSHSQQIEGTGLGLSIVKRVVLYHHGRISLESRPNLGSCFKIVLSKKKLLKYVAKKSGN